MLTYQIGISSPAYDGIEAGLLADVVNIAERALWNPVKVSETDVQTLAAAVLAHVHRQQAGKQTTPSNYEAGDAPVG